jgi:large subunit ribosomal protein L19
MIDTIERRQVRPIPDFRVGDRVRVHFQVVEGTRRRTQVFEGVVLKKKGGGARGTFTVRKLSFGVGVERTFPVHSPKIERVEVMGRGEVRRAKLYYLRGRVGRAARLREMRDFRPEGVATIAAPEQEAAEAQDGAAEAAADEAVAESAEQTEPEVTDEPAAESVEETEPQSEQGEAPDPGDEASRGEQQPA